MADHQASTTPAGNRNNGAQVSVPHAAVAVRTVPANDSAPMFQPSNLDVDIMDFAVDLEDLFTDCYFPDTTPSDPTATIQPPSMRGMARSHQQIQRVPVAETVEAAGGVMTTTTPITTTATTTPGTISVALAPTGMAIPATIGAPIISTATTTTAQTAGATAGVPSMAQQKLMAAQKLQSMHPGAAAIVVRTDSNGVSKPDVPFSTITGATNGVSPSNKRTAAEAELGGTNTAVVRVGEEKKPGSTNVGGGGGGQEELTEQQKLERRERNREHAKRSRLRKKFLLESLQEQIHALQEQLESMKKVIKDVLPDRADGIITKICGNRDKFTPLPTPSGFGPVKTLMEPDFRLMSALSGSQQNFAISDPTLPDNPIVYVSQGFLTLTGYTLDQVLGRNCRFLQGPGTDQSAVEVIRRGIKEGVDTSVCLLNYKADGTPFWNQFFVAALRDAENNVVNFVGVQCEVSKAVVEKHMGEKK